MSLPSTFPTHPSTLQAALGGAERNLLQRCPHRKGTLLCVVYRFTPQPLLLLPLWNQLGICSSTQDTNTGLPVPVATLLPVLSISQAARYNLTHRGRSKPGVECRDQALEDRPGGRDQIPRGRAFSSEQMFLRVLAAGSRL